MKAIYITLFALTFNFLNAQSLDKIPTKSDSQASLYYELVSFITNQKEVTQDKLIALNVWSVNDKNSRDMNLDFDKNIDIYHSARLKGGPKGIVMVMFCIDKDEVKINITLTKDGLKSTTKVLTVNANNQALANLLKDKKSSYNVVFDKDAKVVYEYLQAGSMFKSINNLITR